MIDLTERAALEAAEGIVFDVQRYSLHDGPGLRTCIFLKGCPLRCPWCCNPESQDPQPELAVFAHNCIRCGQFAEPCPARWEREGGRHRDPFNPPVLGERRGVNPIGVNSSGEGHEGCLAGDPDPTPIPPRRRARARFAQRRRWVGGEVPLPRAVSDAIRVSAGEGTGEGSAIPAANPPRRPCSPHLESTHRGVNPPAPGEPWEARAARCPAGGVRWLGERRTAASLLAEVLRDAPFYEGGGGMTLTGGEPLLQPHLAEALLRLAQAECIPTALETCGHAPWPALARLLPYLDAILYDFKHLDSAIHHAFTGAGNELILANLRRLAALGAPVTVRVPLVPGFNASEATLRAMAEFVADLGGPVRGVDLLPYHTLGRSKYVALARAYPWESHAPLANAQVEALAAVVRSYGLTVTVGG